MGPTSWVIVISIGTEFFMGYPIVISIGTKFFMGYPIVISLGTKFLLWFQLGPSSLWVIMVSIVKCEGDRQTYIHVM
jgi:hypothetical protein